MEKTPFFNLVRTHTITVSSPTPYTRNANKVGWQLVRYDDSLNHRPRSVSTTPFPTPPAAKPLTGRYDMAQFTPSTEVDFVVIGSGAAGGIMAKQLSTQASPSSCSSRAAGASTGKEHELRKTST